MSEEWQNVASAPRDGTWFLLRGRNSVNRPMVPVVCAWTTDHKGSLLAYRDSASLKDMTSLVADVPAGSSADWHPLPPLTAPGSADE